MNPFFLGAATGSIIIVSASKVISHSGHTMHSHWRCICACCFGTWGLEQRGRVAVRQPISQPARSRAGLHRCLRASQGPWGTRCSYLALRTRGVLNMQLAWNAGEIYMLVSTPLETGFSMLIIFSGGIAAFPCQKDERRESDYFSTGIRLGPSHFLP